MSESYSNELAKVRRQKKFITTDAVLLEEGGNWVPFRPGLSKAYKTVHAIRLSNGKIWDTVNGWRP